MPPQPAQTPRYFSGRLPLAGALLLLTLPASGCLRLFPRDVEPAFPDRGVELAQNPYEHRNAPEYSRGRIYGFRELWVDADPFADAMSPVDPLPPTESKALPPADAPTLPDGFAPVALVHVDMAELREGRTFKDLTLAASAGRGITLAMPTEALVALKAPEDRRGQSQLVQALLDTEVDGTPLKDLATVEIADGLPKPVTTGQVMPSLESATVLMVAPAPPPPPPPPEKGTLPLDNITTSYAFITVNGEKLGQVPPLARARIKDVRSGIYEVSWELPNGFTWTERLATRNDLGPKVKLEGDRIALLEKVYFDSGRATLQPRSLPLMDELAEVLMEHPELLKVRIEGHTDSDGDSTFNQDLSSRRAAAVADALALRGVERERMDTAGFGEAQPIAPNTDAAGKAANRRVEIRIVERDEGTADDAAAPAAAPAPAPAEQDAGEGADE